MNRNAHILGLISVTIGAYGLSAGTEVRTALIAAGLFAVAAVATFVYEKGLLTRPAAAAGTPAATRGSLLQTKRLMMLMLAIGIVVYAGGGAGTFSSFSAETSNLNSGIASGTLTMSDTVSSTCFSNNAASLDNYQTSCDAALALANQAPGVFGGSAKITLANTGSIDGSQLTVYAPYVNATLNAQISLNSTITSITTTALEGNVVSGDTIELDYAGQSIQMVASANASPTKTSITIANPGTNSCTTVNGSAQISCTSTAAVRAGMSITGTNIPANTTVTSVTNATTLVLSQNATGGGTNTMTFSVKATQALPVGTRVYDVSSNVSSTNTDCFDQLTTTSTVVGAKVGTDLNFNGTDIGDGSHWDSTNNYCKTLLFWVQEQTTPTPAQAATTTNASTSVTVANGALLAIGLSVTGTNIAPNTTIAGISGNTITLSQAATAGGSTTLTFTANYCWVGQGSSTSTQPTTNGMCYAPIGANFATGTTTVTSSTTLLTFAIPLRGNIKSGDTLTISEPTKKVVTCTAGQDAYIGSPSVTVSGCTSTASGWSGVTGETYDGTGATIPATISDTNMNNGLNSDTTDTLSNFDTAHGFNNKLELPPLTANGAHVPSGGGISTLELAKHGSTGDTRSFYVGVYFPAGSGTAQNATQGLSSTFGLSWKLQQ